MMLFVIDALLYECIYWWIWCYMTLFIIDELWNYDAKSLLSLPLLLVVVAFVAESKNNHLYKVGGLMPCWMYKHSYKVGGLMPCWMLDHSYHVESLCSISWESMLYKLGAWCPDWYHMHSALLSWCCCRCIVVDV